MTQQPEHINARYGSGTDRVQYIVLGVVTALLVAATAVFFYLQNSGPKVTYALTSFSVVSDTKVTVTWQMTRPLGAEVYCVIRAQDVAHQDVGYATVTVAPGPATVQTSYRMNTESRATTAEVLACSTSRSVHAPQPNFAPGVPIPVQPSPGIAPAA
jgi:hypothetical protein